MSIRAATVALAAATLTAVSPVGAVAVTSQGAFRVGADAYWSRGITGGGQTVAVLDLGFGGLDAAVAAGELPPREQMVTQSFDRLFGLEGRSALGEPTEHGTRMAEILHDMAPDARLVLVNYGTEEEFLQAVDWIVANRIPIVSHSNSFTAGAFDGTGRLARAVDQAAAAGVLWVNSAGNFAQRHWAGRADATGTAVPIPAVAGLPLSLGIGWRPAPGVAASVSVQRQAADGAWAEVARTGASLRTPVIPVDGGVWRMVVRQESGPATDLEVFSRTVSFGDAAVPEGSVATPGDAVGSLTVGAVTWTGTDLPPYSSWGPTDDGRLKPDLVGPTYVTANPAWPGTAGTSASTAHVAGAAALLRQEREAQGLPAGPAEVRGDLVARTLDLGDPGPDPRYGAGMLRLDVTPPAVSVRVAGSRTRPLARVRVRDDGTLGRLTVRVNGRTLRTLAGPAATVRLPALRRGQNRITATAEDLAGNTASGQALVRR
ncbi:MAG: S8 family serine peptidase [Thermoleophilia bacterium]|nr:S8 family serine peptidase [Thermoleophilia bacterium]